MKVGYVCCEYPPSSHGGIGAVIQNTARRLVQGGHEVRVAGIYPNNEKAPEFEDDNGVQIWRLRESPRKFSWIPARYRLYKLIQEWAKKGEVDVVEVPDWEGYASCWPRLPIPLIVRLHGSQTYFGSEMNLPIRKTATWLESRSFHRADYCSSCSSYTAKRTSDLLGAHKRPPTVLYNSVSLGSAFLDSSREKNTVIYAGTLTKKKGIYELIKAWPQVWKSHPNAELHVYGKDAHDDGQPVLPQLQALIPNDVKGVYFHGHVTLAELRRIYQRCRMAIFPSYSEAFAMAPMEAMAEACPIVCSSRSSGPELIKHDHDGLLVDPADISGISGSIAQLLDDDALATRLGLAGRETIRDRFWSDRVVDQLIHYYSGCLDCFRRNESKN